MAPILKKRRLNPVQVGEITFDPSARQEYLTGFHKRKQARIQNAREAALKREKEERLRERKQLREQRKEELERHIAEFNAELRKQNPDLSDIESDDTDAEVNGQSEEWAGFAGSTEDVAQDEEYVDEDKYTTVTVEAMGELGGSADENGEIAETNRRTDGGDGKESVAKKKRIWAKDKPNGGGTVSKPKKRKFRYESKAERQETRRKQKAKSVKAAKARREGK